MCISNIGSFPYFMLFISDFIIIVIIVIGNCSFPSKVVVFIFNNIIQRKLFNLNICDIYIKIK